MKKYETLPIIKMEEESFFKFGDDKSGNKIKQLVNKYIIFNLKEGKKFITLFGKLLKYEDNMLLIRKYDDGTKETKESWTDYDGTDLFKDWEEYVSIGDIGAIEEYKKSNIDFKEDYKNKVCDITNRCNETIRVLILDYDGFEIEFKWKENTNNNIIYSSFPLSFINRIKSVE